MTPALGTFWRPFSALGVFLAGFLLAGSAANGISARWRKKRPALLPAGRAEMAQCKAFLAAVTASAATGRGGAVLKIAIDGFRTIRAQHGRELAEALLAQFFQALRRLPGTIAVTQVHGDLFALLLPHGGNGALEATCTAISNAISGAYWPMDTLVEASACIGAAEICPHPGGAAAAAEAAMTGAYIALERAKNRGRGARQIYDSLVARTALLEHRLAQQLRDGITRQEIVPYYQPIVSLVTGEVCGFEILARWQHPQLGLLLPASFIHLAEQQHLSAVLSLALLRQVTQDQAAWPGQLRFSFNAPPGQLREVVEFVLQPRRSFPASLSIAPARIELEITENALIEDLEMTRAVTQALHQVGASVAIDDFGTGYANFTHLREIPFDCIKIDKSFVSSFTTDPRSAACVRAIMALAISLNTPTTAEGVENAQTARHLADLGCTHAQGYFFGRPVPASAVPDLLRNIPLRAAHGGLGWTEPAMPDAAAARVPASEAGAAA